MKTSSKTTQRMASAERRCIYAIWSVFFAAIGTNGLAGEIIHSKEFGQQIIELKQGNTTAKLAPAAGANIYSIQVDNVEFLHRPETPEKLAGVSCGVPILYPTPNRVKNAKLSFGGKSVKFPANAGKNFIHGLVNRHAWEVISESDDAHSARIDLKADFLDSSQLAKQFPFPHQLRLSIEVREGSVRWTYTVDNSQGEADVPFGFALHPYFVYQGERARTYLTIPASHWMESTPDRIPTGKLIPAQDLDFQLRQPMSLKETKFDDVFWGMTPQQPTLIDFRDTQRQVTIVASKEFTHLVVWTPARPFFGIESQTCSTDAHNLHSSGRVKEAHLQVCPPGKKLSGWVEYRFTL